MLNTALIMAGGKGERFWPKSRGSMPKQFLNLTDKDKSMIRLTVDRIKTTITPENIFISTGKKYEKLIKALLPDIPSKNIIYEPVGRNTAPCIGFSAVYISERFKNEDVTMVVLPADHMVKDEHTFLNCISNACKIAQSGENIVTISITPTHPDTGYGYIKYSHPLSDTTAFKVERFVEKPDLEKAREYVKEGNYSWNSGIFVWNISAILNAFKNYMPETFEKLMLIKKSLASHGLSDEINEIFKSMPEKSIDYGIMEKASNIYTIPGDFGWDDVGSWNALSRVNKTDLNNNYINGDIVSLNVKNSVIESCSDKLIAAIGIEDLIVVNTDDVLLISTKKNSGDIKKIIKELRENNKNKYL